LSPSAERLIAGLLFGGFVVTLLEEKLIELGTALARSLGHNAKFNCPKVSHAVPCTCGAGAQQAKALDDWQHLMAEVKES
jgi:hypothetical protein